MSNMQELLKELMATNAKIRSLRVIKINRYPDESWFPQ